MTVGLLQSRYTVHEGEMVRICAQMTSGEISKPLVVRIETGFSPDLIQSKYILKTLCRLKSIVLV